MRHRFKDIFWLAERDYRNEWQMSSFLIISLAAVLGPMMILFGLKFGIVGSMLGNLIDDPRNREVHPISSGHYDAAWIEQLRSLPEVEFIIPRTRAIAATIDLKSDTSDRILSVEMIPTGQGDPLLQHQVTPSSAQELVLSSSAARKLNVEVGDMIDGSLARRFQGKSERVHLQLKVAGIANTASFAREGAFTQLSLVEYAEDFRDGRAVPEFNWKGSPANASKRHYPSFRLYTDSIYNVSRISDALNKLGIEVSTRAADIEIVRNMDHSLSLVFWLIAVIGLAGFSFSLGASLWANVDRKRKELSILRLVGFQTAEIIWFPVIQSAFTGILGWCTASLIYLGISLTINHLFASQLKSGEQICNLLPQHYLIALLLTLGSAVVAASLAGSRAARIEPSEGLRDI
ncbi:MAG: FtsX-like permease family protein [Candidatus Thiodiazotropha sp.]|jgi:putative ABC transport system permease protein